MADGAVGLHPTLFLIIDELLAVIIVLPLACRSLELQHPFDHGINFIGLKDSPEFWTKNLLYCLCWFIVFYSLRVSNAFT